MKKIAIIFTIIYLHFFSLSAQDRLPAKPYGGMQEFKQWIRYEMVYPPNELKNKTKGVVTIQAIINKEGEASEIKITKGVNPNIDAEALRLFSKILWEPASQLGVLTAAQKQINIRFSPGAYKSWCKERGFIQPQLPEKIDTTLNIYHRRQLNVAPFLKDEEGKRAEVGRWIYQNIQYPEQAIAKNISGIVHLEFIIEPNGCISNILVKKNLGAGCTEEGIRLARKMRWEPGYINETAVRTRMQFQITFGLDEGSNFNYFPTNSTGSF